MSWANIDKPIMLDFPPEQLCSESYPNHKRGCPNCGKKWTCPPKADIWNADYPCQWWIVWNKFEFGAHVRKMYASHPEWTQRQAECCLYWQNTARKNLHQEIINFMHAETLSYSCKREHVLASCVPEAHGVNVTETMKLVGVDLEWPPKEFSYQVAILCVIGDSVCYPNPFMQVQKDEKGNVSLIDSRTRD